MILYVVISLIMIIVFHYVLYDYVCRMYQVNCMCSCKLHVQLHFDSELICGPLFSTVSEVSCHIL